MKFDYVISNPPFNAVSTKYRHEIMKMFFNMKEIISDIFSNDY